MCFYLFATGPLSVSWAGHTLLILLPQPLECSVYKHVPLHPALNLIFVNDLLWTIRKIHANNIVCPQRTFCFRNAKQAEASCKRRQNFCMNAHTSFLTPLKSFSPCPLCGGSVGSFLWVSPPNASRNQKSWTNYQLNPEPLKSEF